MKEATEFGIKYLQTMPDGHQEFVMHKVVWRSRESAEKALEFLKGVVACPVLVEIWDPAEIEALNEAADEPSTCTGDYPGTLISHPDGTVTVTEDGKDVSDPEQRKRLRENLDHMFDDLLDQWLWLQGQSRKRKTDQELVQDRLPFPISPIWLWNPRQAAIYGTRGLSEKHRPRFQCKADNPTFKCEADS